MSSRWDNIKSGTRDLFRGDEGSIFWMIQKIIEFLKFIAESVNEWLSVRRVESLNRAESNKDEGGDDR